MFRNNKVKSSEIQNWHSVYSKMNQGDLQSTIQQLQHSINSVNLAQYKGEERKYMKENIEAIKEQIKIAKGYIK